jgi:C4-dicarboxylate-specific signal transduction histidine kinase
MVSENLRHTSELEHFCHITDIYGELQLRFHDYGLGVHFDFRDQIMDPFVTSKVRGFGLGLAICRRHLGNLGGSLSLVTENPPSGFKGACFSN